MIQEKDSKTDLIEENTKLKDMIFKKDKIIDDLEKKIKLLEDKFQNFFRINDLDNLLEDKDLNQIIKLNKEDFFFIKNKIEKDNIISKKNKFTSEEELFITFFWLRNYPTDRMMTFIFNSSRKTIIKIIKKNINYLITSFSDLLRWPSDEEFDQFFFSKKPSN